MANHLERIIRIYNRLRRGPVTIEVLEQWVISAGIEVSTRQLYRDLNQIKTLQFAEGESVIEFVDEKNHKTWKLEYDNDKEKLTLFDINSFFLLKNFAPYAILQERKASIEKVERHIYREFSNNDYEKYVRTYELYLRSTNYKDNKYGKVEHNQVEDLIWALHNSRCIYIEKFLIDPANIRSERDSVPVKMYPLELLFHRGRLHIAGVNQDQKNIIYTLDKNLVFRLSNETFARKKFISAYRDNFSGVFGISQPLSDKIYKIKLEFTSGYAHSMKNFHWHDSAQWKQLKNGNFMLELTCSIGRELVGFIAVGLDKVKVHQPKILKEIMIKKFHRSAQLNDKDLAINEDEGNTDF